MSLTAQAIRLMAEKGLSALDIAEIADAIEAAPTRSGSAERMARKRARDAEKASQSDVTCDASQNTPLVPPSLSPTPPNSPPYNPPKTKPRRTDGAPDGAFEVCWKSFPHVKTRMSKNKALTEFNKLPPAEQSSLSQAIKTFDENLRDRDREYVPAMERWLRDGKHRVFLPTDSPEAVPRSDLIRAYRHSGTWPPEWGDKPTPEELAA